MGGGASDSPAGVNRTLADLQAGDRVWLLHGGVRALLGTVDRVTDAFLFVGGLKYWRRGGVSYIRAYRWYRLSLTLPTPEEIKIYDHKQAQERDAAVSRKLSQAALAQRRMDLYKQFERAYVDVGVGGGRDDKFSLTFEDVSEEQIRRIARAMCDE